MGKILIIDDDVDLTESMRLVLEADKHQVIIANGPDVGWEKLLQERPDLLLLDVMMPAATEGFHFVWKLRKHPDESLSKIPVIVLSAIHQTTDIKMYPGAKDDEYAAGEYLPIDKFIDKPFHPEKLVKTVDEFLGNKTEVKRTA